MERQLPVVRELFVRAFLEVQSDTREKSAGSWRKMENDILKGLLGIGTGVTKTKTRTKRKVKPPTSDSSGTKRDNNHNNKGEKDKGEGGFSQRRIITRKSLTLGTTTPYRNHRTRKRSDRGRFVGCYRHQSQQKPTPTPTPTTKTKNKKQKKHTTTIQLPT